MQVIPDEKAVKDLKTKYENREAEYKKAFGDYLTQNTSATLDMFKTVIDIIASNSSDPDHPNTGSVAGSAVERIFGVKDTLNKSHF